MLISWPERGWKRTIGRRLSQAKSPRIDCWEISLQSSAGKARGTGMSILRQRKPRRRRDPESTKLSANRFWRGMDGVVNGVKRSETSKSITGDSAAGWEMTRQKTSSPCASTAIEQSTSSRNKRLCRSAQGYASTIAKGHFLRGISKLKSQTLSLADSIVLAPAAPLDTSNDGVNP